MQQINTFHPDAIKQIADNVRRLEQLYRNLDRRMLQAISRQDRAEVRTAITATSATHPVYPVKGCTFVCQYEDWSFDTTPGVCGRDKVYEWPDKWTVAQVYGGQYLAEGTRVLLVVVPSEGAGLQHWALPLPLELVRFRLTEILCPNQSAAAVLLDTTLSPIAGADPITVFDTVGEWRGDVDFDGWAVKMRDSGKYEIIFLEFYARFIEVELNEDMSGDPCAGGHGTTAVSAKVLNHWGAAPNHKDPRDPQGNVDVYDRAELYPYALGPRSGQPGARAFCVLDEQDGVGSACFGRYVVWVCDQQTLWGTAELQSDMCPGSDADLADSLDEATPPLFGQRPEGVTAALNLYDLAGQAGDQVAIFYSRVFCDWIVLQVQHKERQLITACAVTDIDTGPGVCATALKFTKEKFSIQSCGQSPEVETCLQFQQIDVVVDVYDGEDSSQGDCLQLTRQSLYVACVGASTIETIICFTDCPDASSS